MKITPIKTKAVILGDKLKDVLDQSVANLTDHSVVVITSKIVSICEGNLVPIGSRDKHELMIEESEYYLPPEYSTYGFTLTIKHNSLCPSAGIDESNGNGYYVLWPKNPQKSANEVRKYLSNKYQLRNLGVVIVDSKTTPLRWGVTGISLVYSGFRPLNDYVGKFDIFGRPFRVEKVNVPDGLAASAVLAMGEGDEQTPIAIIEDIPFVQFQRQNPTKSELSMLRISIKEDLYAPILQTAPWQKGGCGK